MQHTKNFQLKEIARLNFLDIKAQKKTIQFKKFQNLELSEEEKVKEKYQSVRLRQYEDADHLSQDKSITKYSIGKTLNKLCKPKAQVSVGSTKNKEIGKILRKCKRLISNGSKFKLQVSRFERNCRLCLSEIERKMNNVISDGLSANYYA